MIQLRTGLLFAIILLVVSIGANVALHRWLTRTFAAFSAHRRATTIAIVVTTLLPLVRMTGDPTLRVIAQWSLLWQLTVIGGMAVMTAYWLAARLAAPARSAAPASPLAATSPLSGGRGGRGAGREGANHVATPPPADDARAPAPLTPTPSRRELIIGASALGASATVWGWGSAVGRFDLRVEEVPIRVAKLPRALDGFTIVQLSDLHVGRFTGERELGMVLAEARRLRGDLIVLTGDIVDNDRAFIPLAARTLGTLGAPQGVVAIPGNHDYYTGARAVLDGLRAAGLHTLVNESRTLLPGLSLVGLDDPWALRVEGGGRGPDLGRARRGVPEDAATVLLAHNPALFLEARGLVDVQLSGHTHGGQINPIVTPARALMRYIAGRYEDRGSTLYVNRGIGIVGPPCRLAAPPEITKIVLVAG